MTIDNSIKTIHVNYPITPKIIGDIVNIGVKRDIWFQKFIRNGNVLLEKVLFFRFTLGAFPDCLFVAFPLVGALCSLIFVFMFPMRLRAWQFVAAIFVHFQAFFLVFPRSVFFPEFLF